MKNNHKALQSEWPMIGGQGMNKAVSLVNNKSVA